MFAIDPGSTRSTCFTPSLSVQRHNNVANPCPCQRPPSSASRDRRRDIPRVRERHRLFSVFSLAGGFSSIRWESARSLADPASSRQRISRSSCPIFRDYENCLLRRKGHSPMADNAPNALISRRPLAQESFSRASRGPSLLIRLKTNGAGMDESLASSEHVRQTSLPTGRDHLLYRWVRADQGVVNSGALTRDR